LTGTRLENHDRGQSWTNHPIGFSKGDHQFLDVVDFDGDGIDDVVDAAAVQAAIRSPSAATWATGCGGR
jgi:hypothetical protein